MRDEYELKIFTLEELHKKNSESLTQENDTLRYLLEERLS